MKLNCKKCGQPIEGVPGVKCEPCGLVATWWNEHTGEVFTMRPIAEHEEACEAMQYELDSAFDNQYFTDEGW